MALFYETMQTAGNFKGLMKMHAYSFLKILSQSEFSHLIILISIFGCINLVTH